MYTKSESPCLYERLQVTKDTMVTNITNTDHNQHGQRVQLFRFMSPRTPHYVYFNFIMGRVPLNNKSAHSRYQDAPASEQWFAWFATGLSTNRLAISIETRFAIDVTKKMADAHFTRMHCGWKSYQKVTTSSKHKHRRGGDFLCFVKVLCPEVFFLASF